MSSRAAAAAAPFPPPARTDSFHGWVTELVHRHRARLIRVARREGVRADDALDCVQESFVSFLSLPQARLLVGLPEDSARMLVILARNIARNRRRRHDYARPHVADDATVLGLAADTASADELIAAAERHAMALGCMVTLSEVQRAVVGLRLIDEVSGEDVARELGVSPGHVAVLLFRAKQHLRACVSGAEAALGPKLAPA
ncbi:MAG TPA: sigma-70 family RNA polymerase sigma factor [Phenylobacterium sp.]|jgi:RNA polymerase sigma-70 factor, ECF subfamily|nr:sigma-70 family RNA polymerase sigma factor [Phenylobacterium sp.]